MKIFSCIREKFKTYDAIRKEESRIHLQRLETDDEVSIHSSIREVVVTS